MTPSKSVFLVICKKKACLLTHNGLVVKHKEIADSPCMFSLFFSRKLRTIGSLRVYRALFEGVQYYANESV